ncbi:MAG: hypothetical protein ACTSXD_01585 [Candidatus Heimdallarchaeaceae archaeon]
MQELKKGEIESPYLDDEIHLKKLSPLHVYWELIKISAWKNFAHHPTCSVYKNHYFNIGGLKLCVGCTSLYSALFFEMILYFIFRDIASNYIIYITITGLIGFSSAVIQYYTKPENKWIKAIFRFILGLGIGSYLVIVLITPKWWLKLILASILILSGSLYSIMRGKANIQYCDICPLHNSEPYCDPFENTRIKAEKINKLVDEQIRIIQEKKAEKWRMKQEKKNEKDKEE